MSETNALPLQVHTHTYTRMRMPIVSFVWRRSMYACVVMMARNRVLKCT